ncbi:hypothetical protein KCP78_02550 [Salmonella enterica subsp. enterica]|nr:hypothetical protein KCP78_02550 [Salmonella enterica subsp. enterica]
MGSSFWLNGVMPVIISAQGGGGIFTDGIAVPRLCGGDAFAGARKLRGLLPAKALRCWRL